MPAPSPESQRVFAPGTFAGKTVLVTGGGSGIGLTTAGELLRLGARVAICGRTGEKLEAAASELAAITSADDVFQQVCDIRESDAADALIDAVAERFGGLDILINNAGGQFPAPAEMISTKGFEAVVRNNLVGTFNMTRAAATRVMIPQKSGRVVNIIANIYRGFPGMAHTGAARAGVENLTMSLAVEWARYNILVNAIAPGIILSSGTQRYPKPILDAAISSCPLARAGTVEEVAASILFLASPAAQYITGTTLRLDGAHSLHGELFPIPRPESS